MLKLTLENIKKFLHEHHVPVEMEHMTNQLHITLKILDLEFPLFLRVYDHNPMLQILIFIPATVKLGLEPDIARLLHLINKEMDAPGFGMDETSSTVFYRVMLSARNSMIDEELILVYLEALKGVCNAYTLPIIAVMTGKKTYPEIYNEMKELRSTTQAKS